MIRSIQGHVTDIDQQLLVVEVNGIGYALRSPRAMMSFNIGDYVRLHTHLAIRENAHDLYGFKDSADLRLFELLIDLPKLGPKSALQILEQADAALITEAVQEQDSSRLSKLSGMGKKTAEKVVQGLKDKLETYPGTSPVDQTQFGRPGANDAVDALIALGYPPNTARDLIREIMATDVEITSSTTLIKLALKNVQS